MRVPYLFVALIAASLVPQTALACRVGGDQIFFETRPAPDLVEGVEVIQVQFTNTSDAFRQSSAPPYLETADILGGSLIGLARRVEGGDWFPVYAGVTSCTHGFFGSSPTPLDADGYLVGRPVRLADCQAGFLAGGNWNGRWHF